MVVALTCETLLDPGGAVESVCGGLNFSPIRDFVGFEFLTANLRIEDSYLLWAEAHVPSTSPHPYIRKL
jgi:hypothetical protein